MRIYLIYAFCVYYLLGVGGNTQAQLPPNFSIEPVSSTWFSVTGIQFDESGNLWGWSKFGQVFLAREDYSRPEVVLDISEEVVTYGDLGLLGFALHPNFNENGFIYLLYMVDPHYFYHYGTDAYDATKSETYQATIGRITRYTVDFSDPDWKVDPDSRKILMGEQNGPPGSTFAMLFDSHGVGSLVFGTDGSLLASCGDGASYKGIDAGAYGENTGSFREQALQAGIIRPDQDIGTLRSQYLHSPNGKVLRINPDTGEGYPSNPFFDPQNPASTASRVWALGFRQPFRFTLMPGTGDHDPAKGNPGTFLLGEVGWAYWEELNVIDQGGKNYGWPLYGGMNARWQFNRWASPTPNLRAPNESSFCEQDYFLFQDLLLEATESPRPYFPHPCNPEVAIPDQIPHFTHQRPIISWSNQDHNPEEQGTHVPGFDSVGQAKIIRFEEEENPVKGDTFTGVCSVGGTFYTGNNFPPAYQMVYFHADYSGWIRQFLLSPDNELLEVRPFADTTKNIVSMAVNPRDGALYYIRYGFYSSLYKISYGGNASPSAKIEVDTSYGPSPLTVNLASQLSFDPDGDSLSFLWEFGDGEYSTLPSPQHVFRAQSSDPASFWVQLKVSDPKGASDSAQILVSVNNSPPKGNIVGFSDSVFYSRTSGTSRMLTAEVSDAEHALESLQYEWQSFLHHNTHFHPNPIQEGPTYELATLPLGCEEESYYYRVLLTLTDPEGLQHRDEQILYPDCGPDPAHITEFFVSNIPNGLSLSWSTLQEVRCEYFEVEHKRDFSDFEVIARIPGQFNSNERSSYSFVDEKPSLGRHYYRIRAVNSFESSQTNSPVSALYFPTDKNYAIFPNPGKEKIHIQVWNFAGPVSFSLYSLSGKLIFKETWAPNLLDPQVFSLPSIPEGVYLYQFDNGEEVQYGKWAKYPGN